MKKLLLAIVLIAILFVAYQNFNSIKFDDNTDYTQFEQSKSSKNLTKEVQKYIRKDKIDFFNGRGVYVAIAHDTHLGNYSDPEAELDERHFISNDGVHYVQVLRQSSSSASGWNDDGAYIEFDGVVKDIFFNIGNFKLKYKITAKEKIVTLQDFLGKTLTLNHANEKTETPIRYFIPYPNRRIIYSLLGSTDGLFYIAIESKQYHANLSDLKIYLIEKSSGIATVSVKTDFIAGCNCCSEKYMTDYGILHLPSGNHKDEGSKRLEASDNANIPWLEKGTYILERCAMDQYDIAIIDGVAKISRK